MTEESVLSYCHTSNYLICFSCYWNMLRLTKEIPSTTWFRGFKSEAIARIIIYTGWTSLKAYSMNKKYHFNKINMKIIWYKFDDFVKSQDWHNTLSNFGNCCCKKLTEITGLIFCLALSFKILLLEIGNVLGKNWTKTHLQTQMEVKGLSFSRQQLSCTKMQGNIYTPARLSSGKSRDLCLFSYSFLPQILLNSHRNREILIDLM